MEIDIKHFDGKYPSFNVLLSSKAGTEPFLEIKGCRIVDGKDGSFVSWPATKNDKTGKWWNHVWGSANFNQAVLNRVLATMPKKSAPKKEAPPVDEDDIPF